MSKPIAPITNLQKRSELLRIVREFFHSRNFTEVETPLLSGEVIPEQHIEPFAVPSNNRDAMHRRKNYLQASPELHMKRLVSAGMEAIFQITRSFRGGERGPLHNPEFTILEWYRTGDDLNSGMQLLDDLCQTTLSTLPAKRTSYADAFQTHVDLCPHSASIEQLSSRADELKIAVAENFRCDDRDEWLNLLLSFQVEPQLGLNEPEILFDYPASQAALAKTARRPGGVEVAERLELYWQGVELANGYHELTDASELRTRLDIVNQQRLADNRPTLPLPESLLQAMEMGLPDCAGCALGFDRLVMLACKAQSIDEVIAISSD